MSEGILYVTDSRTFLEYEIPIHRNTIKAADFKALKAPSAGTDPADQVSEGIRLFDPGFKNTAASQSEITFIDGAQGVVQYRGHNLAEFWQTAEFEDLAYLLVWAHWPSKAEKEAFRKELATAAQKVPDSVSKVIQSFPSTAAPMQMVIAGLAAYLGEYPESIPAFSGRNLYSNNLAVADKALVRTLACFQVCAGLAACHRAGIPFTPVDGDKSFLYNLLLMMGKVDKATGKPDLAYLFHIQRLWALGADLGHTNSTSALLLGASSLSDPLSCLISALSSGYGISHFGAAEASYKALAAVGKKENVPYMIAKVKRQEAKLFGYGHRMFNTIDPRIPFGTQVMSDIDSKHPLVEVAMEIDRVAGQDDYFVSRNLQANADLFIGILYTALDFDASMVPVMLALMRSGGMMAHWREAMGKPPVLWRPQQFYTGQIGALPGDGPNSTAAELNKEASTICHVEYLFGGNGASEIPPESTTHQTQAVPEENKTHLPVTVDDPSHALPSATIHTAVSVVTKSSSDESEPTSVVTSEASATYEPAGKPAQIAPAA